jgi:hypothetical protein
MELREEKGKVSKNLRFLKLFIMQQLNFCNPIKDHFVMFRVDQ